MSGGMRWHESQLLAFQQRGQKAQASIDEKAGNEAQRALGSLLTPLGFTAEYQFHPVRRWRFDFALPALSLAVEIDGGVHVIRERFAGDLEKLNAAALAGWLVIRVTPGMAMDLQAIELVHQAMALQRARLGKSHEERDQ